MIDKAIIISSLAVLVLFLTGCRDRDAELAAAHEHGFCLRYAMGLAGVTFEHGTVTQHREELDKSFQILMRGTEAHASALDAWWKGYYEGDVHLRTRLPSWASGTAVATEADIDTAVQDFRGICKEQLAASD
jgi:hypothetical protein